MFDGSLRDEHLAPRNRSAGVFLLIAIAIGFWLVVAATTMAVAQQPPSPPAGQSVIDSSFNARLITKSDTAVITATRGIYIGDAAACIGAMVFNRDTAAVTFASLQPGTYYPFSIIKLTSATTTCTAVIALY